MRKKKGVLLPVFACVTLLAVGLASVALTVVLPLPEERAFNTLSQIKIKSVRWSNVTPSKAVEELNRELQKAGHTHFRLVVAEGANDVKLPVGVELDDIPVTELAFILVTLTENKMYKSPEGIIIDRENREAFYETASWRRDLHDWAKYRLPWGLGQWYEPPPPIRSAPSVGYDPSTDPFAPPAPK